MCGIAGLFNASAQSSPTRKILEEMSQSLVHRGPDSGGIWVDSQDGVGFAHRRLSIVDLGQSGDQPIRSRDGAFIMAFNGEIYNHLEIREKLSLQFGTFPWVGHSDTETLVEAFSHWGVAGTLQHIRGMFAVALWDVHHRRLQLIRDRFGEKPLYFGVMGGILGFASELKALKKIPGWQFEPSLEALDGLLRFGYIQGPSSIYKSISQIPPGSSVTFSKESLERNHSPDPARYWSFAQRANLEMSRSVQSPSLDDAAAELDHILSLSVREQLLGDVPVGAFLSGGIDSSLVVGLMQKHASQPVKTFSIGFEDSQYDESRFARKIAKELGTDHYSLKLTSADAQEIIPTLATVYDEPFADSSQIPTVLVSQLARRHVTVSLSGDGADELFGGYERYRKASALIKSLTGTPQPLRKIGSNALRAGLRIIEQQRWAGHGKTGGGKFLAQQSQKISKIAAMLEAGSEIEMYKKFVATGNPSLIFSEGVSVAPDSGVDLPIHGDLVHQMMALDTTSYLTDDLLVKVDRAAMSQSLETRMPFLDERVVQYAWSLPTWMKVGPGKEQSKLVLKKVLGQYVSPALLDRPKQGFAIPLADWMKGPVRDWAEDLISPGLIRQGGYFSPAAVQYQWAAFLNGAKNQQFIWSILMFQSWLGRAENSSPRCE